MPHVRRRDRMSFALVSVLATATLLTACAGPADLDADPAEVEPVVGACRVLGPDDVAGESDDSPVVDCAAEHTAETFAVGDLPADLADAAYDDGVVGAFVYDACATGFREFVGADESLAMRTVLSWAGFRPSEEAWDDGARWYRCDVVGGGEQSASYVDLPRTAEGVLVGKPGDRWLACVDGTSVTSAPRVPCTEPHTWRAVTTIKLGEADDDYPGDRQSELRTREFCSDSVGAWLNYPVTYDFGYTWFHEAEWKAGNRRSVCWARTES